jgi:hypothetical protein
MEPILHSARTQYLVGTVYAGCGKSDEALVKFQSALTATAPDQTIWAWLAAKKLPGIDETQWHERLQSALLQLKSRGEASAYTSWWEYNTGTIETALNHPEEANLRFQKALLLPDRMLAHHFTRLALAHALP